MPRPLLRAFTGRFRADERGAVSILGAMMIVLGLGLGVLVIDVGHFYLDKRRLQNAVDAAALAAAGNIANAGAVVPGVLQQNGYADTTASVEPGVYDIHADNPGDPASEPAGHFTASGSGANAVRVTKTVSETGFLVPVFGSTALPRITATATAARNPYVSFAAGTGLANLDTAALNSQLWQLFNRTTGTVPGDTLTLSLADYDGLLAARADALSFLDRLAVRADVASTYGALAGATVSVGDILTAATAALDTTSGADAGATVDLLNRLQSQIPPTASVQLRGLLDATLWQDRQIGTILQQKGHAADLGLFDLVTAAARLYGNGQLIDTGINLSLPAGTTATARVWVGAPMASVALGRVGTAISTAQARIALNIAENVPIDLPAPLNALATVSAAINLPLYLDIASGTARVAAIPCGGVMTRIAATPQVLTAQVGGIAAGTANMDFSTMPALTPAGIALTVKLAGTTLAVPVAISAQPHLVSGAETMMDFTRSQIDAGTVQSASASGTGNLFSGLNLNLTVGANSVAPAILNAVLALLPGILDALLASVDTALDPVLDQTLESLGLRLGTIDVAVRGVNCAAPVLVH